jgi:translation initiation factor 2B subunit (eIF-2B alpha/beta/delta family)
MDIKKIENLQFITDFKKKLRKKQYPNSTIIAIETAKLFRDLINELSKFIIKNSGGSFRDLLSVLRSLGKSFISVDPLQFVIGNIIKRVNLLLILDSAYSQRRIK